MKISFCLLLVFCETFGFALKEFQPKNSTIIEMIDGDLDGDKISEKIIVYDITSENLREIQVLKKKNNKWLILEKSRNVILGS